jgi:hypothetical protein
MPALERWKEIEAELDPAWDEVFLSFVPEDAHAMSRAAAILGPLGPGRSGRELRLQVARGGAGLERLENLLGRLDRNRVWGELALVGSEVSEPAEPAPVRTNGERPLVEQWEDELAKLPPGWRDASATLELDSTDFLAQATLAGAPLNPSRVKGETALRFSVVTRGLGGYGVPPGMVRRCLERMDAIGITGRLQVRAALSDVDYVATQGVILA